jgi:hypothetical protein
MFFIICPLFSGGNWGSDTCNKAQFIALFQTGWFVESMWSQSLGDSYDSDQQNTVIPEPCVLAAPKDLYRRRYQEVL